MSKEIIEIQLKIHGEARYKKCRFRFEAASGGGLSRAQLIFQSALVAANVNLVKLSAISPLS
jgi:hypothetical protein